MTSFCFNFANLFELCLVSALLHAKGKNGEHGNPANEKLAMKVEKWSKICLPLLYVLFVVIFFGYSSGSVVELKAKPGRKLTPLQEVEMEF